MFKEAGQAAFDLKDVQILRKIRAKSTNHIVNQDLDAWLAQLSRA